jgi:hypothetical protein
MRKAAAKLQKKLQPHKKNIKIMAAEANFSLFTLHFSLYFCTFATDKSIK